MSYIISLYSSSDAREEQVIKALFLASNELWLRLERILFPVFCLSLKAYG